MGGEKLITPFPEGEREPVKPAYSAIHILSALHLVTSPTLMGVAVQDTQ